MFNFDERLRSSDADDCTLASTSAHEKAGRVLIVLSVFILHQLEKKCSESDSDTSFCAVIVVDC